MSECAVAAYQTVPHDFVLDSLQAHFLGRPNVQQKLRFKVERLSNGKRFVVRAVNIEQNDAVLLSAILSFVSTAPWTGPQLKYSASRQTNHKVNKITLDDLEPFRSRQGSFMKVQRLPLVYRCILLTEPYWWKHTDGSSFHEVLHTRHRFVSHADHSGYRGSFWHA